MPFACQILRGTTGNSGYLARADRSSSTTPAHIIAAAAAKEPQASQAESASSILVTRSHTNPQFMTPGDAARSRADCPCTPHISQLSCQPV